MDAFTGSIATGDDRWRGGDADSTVVEAAGAPLDPSNPFELQLRVDEGLIGPASSRDE